MAKHKVRRHKRGRPSKGSARETIAKAITLLQQAKTKIHVRAKGE